MTFRMNTFLACVLSIGISLPFQAIGKEYVFPELKAGKVLADIPIGWLGNVPPNSVPDVATARFTPDSQDYLVLVTVMVASAGSPLANANQESIKNLVTGSAEKAAAQSEEGTLKVESFSTATIFGSYFSATDRAPPPGEYKYMSQGVASFGKLAVTFTALSHRNPGEVRGELLGVVKSLKLVGGTSK